MPASENDLFMHVTWAQRLTLELHARIQWIRKEWSKRLRDAKLQKKIHEVINVVGVFTEDKETLHTLFYAGIPVWWLRVYQSCSPVSSPAGDIETLKIKAVLLQLIDYTDARPKAQKLPKENGGRNPFLSYPHPFMPVAICKWEIALKHLARYHTSHPEDGGHYNYWVPPTHCLLSVQSDEKKAKLFMGWLRIQELCLFLLSNAKCSPLRLSNKEWRTLLLNLFTKSVQWKGTEVKGLPHAETAYEILWELCELNFRSGFVALNRQLDESTISALEHQSMLDQCWNGTAAYLDLFTMRQELGGQSIFELAAFVQALHTVMKTW
ncbi:hypothetical protein GYMLUDRAFT_62386 [Collybiopsis luxurians FD-317 M1]|uniref:Uncharacterized protein n=1 Tax=Collybiopsis luxurians FD-317 M1 TaxID=944289 RepID=A0A0D0C031_9AGAR|nr:hypothetical protein GYMLUDRAFT_62386 [Collybiopsis luxurians FD-317 M1]